MCKSGNIPDPRTSKHRLRGIEIGADLIRAVRIRADGYQRAPKRHKALNKRLVGRGLTEALTDTGRIDFKGFPIFRQCTEDVIDQRLPRAVIALPPFRRQITKRLCQMRQTVKAVPANNLEYLRKIPLHLRDHGLITPTAVVDKIIIFYLFR